MRFTTLGMSDIVGISTPGQSVNGRQKGMFPRVGWGSDGVRNYRPTCWARFMGGWIQVSVGKFHMTDLCNFRVVAAGGVVENVVAVLVSQIDLDSGYDQLLNSIQSTPLHRHVHRRHQHRLTHAVQLPGNTKSRSSADQNVPVTSLKLMRNRAPINLLFTTSLLSEYHTYKKVHRENS